MAVAMEGIGVKLVQRAPQRMIQLRAVQGIEFDACVGDAPALALYLLALLGGKGCEKGLKGFVALVIPMELAIATQYQSGSLQTRGAFVGGEKYVPGRQLFAAYVIQRGAY